MPLVYLLYRCPRCGHDPMEGEGDEARCPSCGTRYSRARVGGRLRVQDREGGVWEVPSHRLSAAVDGWNAEPGQESEVEGGGAGGFLRRAHVEVRRASREAPFRFAGELLGFVESLGEAREAVLEIAPEALRLWPGGTPGPGLDPGGDATGGLGRKTGGDALGGSGRDAGGPSHAGAEGGLLEEWPLLDIRAVQTSSSSLQISPQGGGVVQFRFQGDSPRRWEDLLRRTLREAYRRAGRGEILEFQPRIVTR